MKRTDPCPDCDASGKHPTAIVVEPKLDAEGQPVLGPDGQPEQLELPAQCNRCAGTGKVGEGYVKRPVLEIPLDHPRAQEIAELLKGGSQ